MPRRTVHSECAPIALIVLSLMIGVHTTAIADQADDQLSRALKTFEDRVTVYVGHRNRLDRELPQPALGDSEAVEAHRKAIVQAI